jgi:chitin synthase
MMIFGLCGIILFYIILFSHLLCPGPNSVWSKAELGGQSTPTNFWVVVAGEVYNITPSWCSDHRNILAVPVTQTSILELAGMKLTHYFPVPLITGCLGFVTDVSLALQAENFSAQVPNAMHYSGQ